MFPVERPKNRRPTAPETPAAGQPARGTRPRRFRLDVWVDEDDRAEIQARAAHVRMPVSAYLRALGLNTPIQSQADAGVMLELMKVHGDLGRLGGLLKLWLADRRDEGAPAIEVDQVLKEIRTGQRTLLRRASELRVKR
jgi:hypothetical protein